MSSLHRSTTVEPLELIHRVALVFGWFGGDACRCVLFEATLASTIHADDQAKVMRASELS